MIVFAIAASFAMKPDPQLRDLCQRIGQETVAEFAAKGLKEEMFGFAVSILGETDARFGGFRENETFYPASVVKAFYMNYAANEIGQERLKPTEEFHRAMRDMIIDSSNDATGLIVDVLTGTTGGPSLEGKAWDEWREKRQVVNRWYLKRGYMGVNACQKTWGDGPYGRERDFYGAQMDNRNRLTALSGVRLFSEIARRASLEPPVHDETKDVNWMATLLTRRAGDPQFDDFIGKVAPEGALVRSKAGWTSTSRSDVAWIKLENKEMVIAVFTNGREVANEPAIIQNVAKKLIEGAK